MTLTRETVAALSDAELLRLGAAISGEQSARAAHRTNHSAEPALALAEPGVETPAAPSGEHLLDRLFREAAEKEGVRF